MPSPDLIRPPAVPMTWPPRVAVTCGLVTVMVRANAPRSTTPLSVRLWPAPVPPTVKPVAPAPTKETAFAMVRAVLSVWMVVAPLITSDPMPIGPEVTTVGMATVLAMFGVLSCPKIRVPAVNWKLPLKVLPKAVRVLVPPVTPVPVVTVICVGLTIEAMSSPAGRPVPVMD